MPCKQRKRKIGELEQQEATMIEKKGVLQKSLESASTGKEDSAQRQTLMSELATEQVGQRRRAWAWT